MKNKSFNIANMPKYGYINRALGKISKLALTGYKSQQAYCPKGLFLCVKSLCVRISMVKLERDTFECVGIRLSLSTNPFQLCHPHLVVNGKAPLDSNGAHSHA